MKRSREELHSHYKKCKLNADQDEKELFINCLREPPSLQSIAVVSIAVKLWTEPDTINELEHCYKNRYSLGLKSNYKKLKEKVLNQLSHMVLPKSLELSVSYVMRPIVLQLLRCFDSHDGDYYPFYELLKGKGTVYWTMEGTIDRARSLKELIKSGYEVKNLKRLFYFSCQYCLEECVTELWGRLSPEEKDAMCVDADSKHKSHIVVYWTCLLRNEMHLLFSKIMFTYFVSMFDTRYSVYQNMVSLSVYAGNSFALKYFWHKLTAHEKTSNVKNWLIQIIMCSVHMPRLTMNFQFQECYVFADILCFLLSNLSDEMQRKEFFQLYSFFVLKFLFFCWPYERFFASAITAMFDYLEEWEYLRIMRNIADEMGKCRGTLELFRKIWLLSPLKLRSACIKAREISKWGLVWKCIIFGDVGTLSVILKDFDAQRNFLVYDVMVNRKLMFYIVSSENLHLLDEVALKAISPDCYDTLKNRCMLEAADFLFDDLTCKGAFQKARRFLEWGFGSPEKVKDFKKNKINLTALFHRLMYGDCENLNQFMMWYFETEKAVCEFKKSFILKTTELHEWGMVVLNFSDHFQENSWQRFEDFITWCIKGVYTSRKISHFKKQFLRSVVSVLRIGNFAFATKFVNWCLDSSEEVNRFKTELVVSEGVVVDLLLFEVTGRNPDWGRVTDVLQWFSPLSNEVVASLMEALNEKNNNHEYEPELLCNLIEHFNEVSNNENEISKRRATVDLTNDDSTESEDYEQYDRDPFHYI